VDTSFGAKDGGIKILARKMERDFGLSMAHGRCIQPAANWRLMNPLPKEHGHIPHPDPTLM